MGIAGGIIGYNLPHQLVVMDRQVIVEKPVYIDKLVEVPVYIDRVEIIEKPIIEIVEVEKVIEFKKIVYEKRTDWRFFKTLPEFTTWLEDKMVNLMPPADCDDYAQRLQREAYKDSYFLSIQVVADGKLFDKVVSDDKRLHMGNLVMIDNGIYYVNLQPGDFRIIRICNRD